MVVNHLNLKKKSAEGLWSKAVVDWSIRCIETSLSVYFVSNIAQDFPLQEKHQKTLIILTDPLGGLKRSPIPPSRKKGREGEFGPEGMGREEDRKELGVGRNRGS